MRKIFFLMFLLISFAYSEEKTPIVVESDTLEYMKKENLILYKGNVIVKKDDFILNSDLLKVFLDKDGEIKKIVAIGNVKFKKGNRKGESEKAEYFKDKSYIILTGNAQLQQDSNMIEGDEIIYYLDTEKAEVIGKKKRVRSIFFPKNRGKSFKEKN